MIVTVYELMVGSGKINSKQKCYKENLMKRYSLTWKREIQGEEENCQVIGGGRGGGFLEVPAHYEATVQRPPPPFCPTVLTLSPTPQLPPSHFCKAICLNLKFCFFSTVTIPAHITSSKHSARREQMLTMSRQTQNFEKSQSVNVYRYCVPYMYNIHKHTVCHIS